MQIQKKVKDFEEIFLRFRKFQCRHETTYLWKRRTKTI